MAYERTYRGLPVVGGDAVVLADGQGRIRGQQNAAPGVSGVPTTTIPAVSAADAERTVRTRLAAVDGAGPARLVVKVTDGRARLAWESVLTGRTASAASRLHVYVDARTGAVLDGHDLGGTAPGDDFSLAVNPAGGTVTPGGSTTATVATAVTSGSARTVALTATGLPSGVTVSFSPSSVQSGASAMTTVPAAAGTAAGTYSITVAGSGPATHGTT
ncbi:hypothetical protein [Kitasatospora sp. DSM 101779]|uniref:hypothetical protein n=1 Tax=Kitasatospora sp. DSM 101779 TaxID=2853165 RepID=UPI0021D8D072|nr:hypothetical protein [Kitasatospora sp. DSM 101779]